MKGADDDDEDDDEEEEEEGEEEEEAVAAPLLPRGWGAFENQTSCSMYPEIFPHSGVAEASAKCHPTVSSAAPLGRSGGSSKESRPIFSSAGHATAEYWKKAISSSCSVQSLGARALEEDCELARVRASLAWRAQASRLAQTRWTCDVLQQSGG